MTKHTYTIKPNELQAVALASSAEEKRYYLKGVLCELYNDNTVGLIATDGHRLASINTQLGETVKDSFILAIDDVKKAVAMAKAEQKTLGKRSGLQVVIRIYREGENLQVELAIRDNVAIGKIAGGFTAKPVDGSFPEWRRVIPADNNNGDDAACPAISFNGHYMASFANMANHLVETKISQLVIKATDKESPIKITMPDAPTFLGVLMPMGF